MKTILVLAAAGVAALSGCKKDASALPGTEQGARELLSQFLKPGADHATLSRQLRPKSADYAAVFDAAVAPKLEAGYTPAWERGAIVVAPKAGQTDLKLWAATSDELKAGTGNAPQFPGGYRKVAPSLKGGVTLYRFKFVKAGESLGMAYDGLAHVNGRWVIFPKPWRALR